MEEDHLITESRHYEIKSESIQEIIGMVPQWIVRWGISLVFFVLVAIIIAASLIRYPDVVKSTLKINSLNSPKGVLAKKNGKLTSLLVHDGQSVISHQPLAYIETIANPEEVFLLGKIVKEIRANLLKKRYENIALPTNLNLGELQENYQAFFQQYLEFKSTQKTGYYAKRKRFLEQDLKAITLLKSQIIKQKNVQLQEYANVEEEYKAYQKLFVSKVISRSEFVQQQNKFFAAKYPLELTETSILNNSTEYAAKEKELLDLEHVVVEEQSKFLQSLNELSSSIDGWIAVNVLLAPFSGKLNFAGFIQVNQNIVLNQELFIIDPGNNSYFGEIQIPQVDMGKIRIGDKVLIKMHSYPFEQYGMIRGKLNFLSDVPYRDSVFTGKVVFTAIENKDLDRRIILKNGMQAKAEIITDESSLLSRFFRSFTRIINDR